MKRTLVVVLLVVGCSSKKHSTSSSVSASASGPPPTPYVAPCSFAGSYAGEGDDEKQVHWTFTLELAQQGDRVSGSFSWRSAVGNAGKDSVTGSLDCSTSRINLVSASTEGSIVGGSYALSVSADGRSIDGTWTCEGAGCSPGKLTGKRL